MYAPQSVATIYERATLFNLTETAVHFVVLELWLMFAQVLLI